MGSGEVSRDEKMALRGTPTQSHVSPSILLGPVGFNSPNIAQRHALSVYEDPLGPLVCIFSNMAQPHALHVEETAEKAFMLSDRVLLSSAEAREEGIMGGSVGVFELSL